jgi:SAM-dependent methyltransferase
MARTVNTGEKTVSEIYRHPEYYDIAFSFRDTAREVDIMEEAIRRHSGIPVKRVFEVACGNAPHMAEWVARGYRYSGLDLSDAMLAYSQRLAEPFGDKIELIQGDLTDFKLDTPVDFAYVMLGSLYAQDTAQMIGHFDSVARALRPGGLYFLDWCIEFDPFTSFAHSWDEERDGIRVQLTYLSNLVDRVNQTLEEHITLDVDDHGLKSVIEQVAQKRCLYPQEFLTLLEWRGHFEFVGWWNDWDLSIPLDGRDTIYRPVTLIRRKTEA